NQLQSAAMGEGWSDFWAMAFTQRPGDLPMDAYPLGTYDLGQDNGPDKGIRRYPYSFDYSIDALNYGDYTNSREAHSAGEIWASALWDLNWILTDKYGYSPDLYNGGGGNNLTLKLVTEALKLQPSNPTFLNGRDAILAADFALTGGANQKEIWTAFARRGMGVSASDGGSVNALSVTAAFDTPYGDIIGNNAADARVTKNFSDTAASIEFNGDQDFFQIQVEAGKQYTFRTVSGTLNDTQLTLLDSDGSTVIKSNDDALPLHSSEILWTATATKTVYLKANAGPTHATDTGTYELQVFGSAAPVLGTSPTTAIYEANGPAVALDPTGFTVTDVDNVNFARGVLTFKITSNATNFDRLEIINNGTGTNQIGLDVNKITYGGVVIGVIQGSSTDKTVFLNGNATPAGVQELLRNITFRTVTGTPNTGRRSIQIQLNDGTGALSNVIVKNVGITLPSNSLASSDVDAVFAAGV
ncbi:MAG: M36 family metallopeptidase, partial [Planctomycetales bacterium]